MNVYFDSVSCYFIHEEKKLVLMPSHIHIFIQQQSTR